ncbi:MAG: aminopeptidase P family protein, partial [Rhodospirillaceae bacterium]|nr:aminopeptidase P family protein [Rhodospirillaceae bacterium]
YLSDYWGPILQMSHNFVVYALLPRDPNAPAALIMPASGVYHLEHQPTWMPNVVAYVTRIDPRNMAARDFNGATEDDGDIAIAPAPIEPAVAPMPYPTRPGAAMAARDETLLSRYERYRGKLEPTALYALKRALKDAGLEHGNLGFDDPRVLGWLQAAGTKHVTGMDALNVFKEIRMVKTEAEIALLKTAGRITETALNAVIDAITPGLPLADISTIFAAKAASLGGRAEWIIANIRGLATGVVEPNELIKLDSVASYKEYRGDVGRTVICGQPTPEMIARNKAVQRALEIAYENIRPGKTFAEVSELTLKAVHAEGFPGFVIAGPHSVGLEHTDHPTSVGPELPSRHKLVFEENMVFTLDMPYHEFGWGTMHVEDMMIVRKDGCEPISSMDTSLRVKPI